MSDAADAPFPPEEICAQAQSNAAAWILTMIAYLKERGGAVEDCVAYHGRSFAPAWEELRGRPVEEVAQLVALNATRDVYAFVPDLPLDQEWTDAKLYKRYRLTEEEIAFIESQVAEHDDTLFDEVASAEDDGE